MTGQLWIEPVGKIILVRMRGAPTEALIKECQERISLLIKETDHGRILYDTLEMDAPPVEVPISQWRLDEEFQHMKLRRAIVVPNTRLAYLTRLAFAEGDYRVFYNDLTAALNWLEGEPTIV